MIKLTKKVKDGILYWEVWEDDKTLLIHYGNIGSTGETQEIKLSLFQKAERIMQKLAEEKINEGYEYIDEEQLIELVIQYSYADGEIEVALEKRDSVEELMNECLGWTGNGHCDGGDIGSGTANIFNYVIDVSKALKTIKEELSDHNLLDGAKIAYLNKEDEEYTVIYPQYADFELI